MSKNQIKNYFSLLKAIINTESEITKQLNLLQILSNAARRKMINK